MANTSCRGYARTPLPCIISPENCSGNSRQQGTDQSSVAVPTAHQKTTVGIVVETLHASCMSWPGSEDTSEICVKLRHHGAGVSKDSMFYPKN